MTMGHLTDTMRVELSIPPALFWKLTKGAIQSGPDQQRMLTSMGLAAHAVVHDISAMHAAKIRRRVGRAVDALIRLCADQDASKCLVAACLWVKDLIDDDVIILHEGSDFANALLMVHEALDNDDRCRDVLRSAKKLSGRFHAVLSDMGLYRH